MPSKKNRRFSAISCSVILTLLYNITFSQNNKPQIFVPKERINFEAATKSIMFQSEPFGFRKPSNLDKDWRVSLTGLISKNESHKDSLLHAIKKQKELLKFDSNSNQKKSNSVETSASTTTPVLGTNFEGIDNGGGNSP